MTYKAQVTVTLRPSILDPQGKATHHALTQLEFDQINHVRIGKFIEMEIEAPSPGDAQRIAEEAADKLLANPVMEDFSVHVEEVQPVG